MLATRGVDKLFNTESERCLVPKLRAPAACRAGGFVFFAWGVPFIDLPLLGSHYRIFPGRFQFRLQGSVFWSGTRHGCKCFCIDPPREDLRCWPLRSACFAARSSMSLNADVSAPTISFIFSATGRHCSSLMKTGEFVAACSLPAVSSSVLASSLPLCSLLRNAFNWSYGLGSLIVTPPLPLSWSSVGRFQGT